MNGAERKNRHLGIKVDSQECWQTLASFHGHQKIRDLTEASSPPQTAGVLPEPPRGDRFMPQ